MTDDESTKTAEETELNEADLPQEHSSEASAAEATDGAVEQSADQEDVSGEEAGDEPDEGDIAADYLEELLDIADLDGDIDIEVRGERTYISIVAEEGGDDLQDLVGRKGEVLDSLQELSRLAVLTATGQRTRLVLDIAGHREKRHSELKQTADDAISEVQEHGNDVHLEPMSAYERKIVHDFVAEAGLVSESEGEGKRRHVVVSAS